MGNSDSKLDFSGAPSLFFFKLKDNIGEGSFGKVRVIKHRQTRQLYALKYVDKAKAIRMKAVRSTIAERDFLEEIKHPFVVNLRYAFQDEETCFFVLDLMTGGDLKQHLSYEKRFSEGVVRLWFAELSSALSYLHERRICHRDVKPDNILLDEHGHVHLTDFGVAGRFEDRVLLRGLAGTPTYMAPEMFRKKGYTQAIDWWALAVTMYELLFGFRPFRGVQFVQGDKATQEEIAYADSIGWAKAKSKLPAEHTKWCSPRGLDILQKMLASDVNERLGYGLQPGSAELNVFRAHPWLEGIDFDAVEKKEAPCDFIPDLSRAVDPLHKLNENVLAPTALKARKYDADQDTKKMSPEMRTLHERFFSYNWERQEVWSKQAHMARSSISAASMQSSSGKTSEGLVTPTASPPGTPSATTFADSRRSGASNPGNEGNHNRKPRPC